MSGSPPLTPPPSSPHPKIASPDRLRIKTPHPKAFLDSPARLTPKKLNLHFVSTDSPFTPLKRSDASEGEPPGVELLAITSIEKADEVFETAVCYLDAAYLNPAKPKYNLILQAQDLLCHVLISLRGENDWRLRAFCKIEMARVSSASHFQQYWIEKGLNDLDIYFQTTCLLIKHKNLDLVNEVTNCSATYLNISKLCQDNLPDLFQHAFKKHQECESYLQHLNPSVNLLPTTLATSPAKDNPSTVHKTKAVFFFSLSIFILGLAIAQHRRSKHIILNLFKTTIIPCVQPGWVILSRNFRLRTEFLKILR
jgi:hypothetical protein